MKQIPQQLFDAFFEWFRNDPHSTNEDAYAQTITHSHLSGMSRAEFIDFFYEFGTEGGKIQDRGYRTKDRLRAMIEAKYEAFRAFLLQPFEDDFDEREWLAGCKEFDCKILKMKGMSGSSCAILPIMTELKRAMVAEKHMRPPMMIHAQPMTVTHVGRFS